MVADGGLSEGGQSQGLSCFGRVPSVRLQTVGKGLNEYTIREFTDSIENPSPVSILPFALGGRRERGSTLCSVPQQSVLVRPGPAHTPAHSPISPAGCETGRRSGFKRDETWKNDNNQAVSLTTSHIVSARTYTYDQHRTPPCDAR